MRSWARWVLVGRVDGIRASIRARTGFFTWLDRADTAPPPPPEPAEEPLVNGVENSAGGWIRVLERAELKAGDVVEVFAGDQALVLMDVDGAVHAVDSLCPHAGGPLGDGQLDGTTLTCPWHGWSFDVSTGSCAVSDDVHLQTFPVRVADGSVFVDLQGSPGNLVA